MQAGGSDTVFDSPEGPVEDPVIPGYRVVRPLGLGGMATVYLAVQESLDREVAIKVMRPSRQLDEAQTRRFEHEAHIIAKLQHPSIVVIHEVGRTQQGELYYVMPYLAKGDLSVRDYRDDEPGLIALLRALLDALGYAHARGIVHRDVKAENVLFDNADRPQLADFGIALAQREVNSRITGDGLVIGTSAQMSPEQARADIVDGRSDLYSLGVLSYELLTGELPFSSLDPLSLALMHAQDPVPRLPPEKAHWQAFIDCAMAKRPEQRFRNAQAMQRALEPIRRHLRRAAGPIGRLLHAMSHRPALLIATGVLLAISLISLALPAIDYLRARIAQTTAASADPAPASLPGEAKTLDELRMLAAEQMSTGAVFTPNGANASETWLVMLRRDPGNAEAIAGIDSIIATSTPALLQAAADADPEELRKQYEQTERVATAAGLREHEAFHELRRKLREAMYQRIVSLADAGQTASANSFMQLVGPFEFVDSEFLALEKRLQNQPLIGHPVRDAGGGTFLIVPAILDGATLGKTFMMMRDEVSRADYAEFARRTNRGPGRCRNSLSPLRIFDRRGWSDPGFRQSASDPAVCVSFDDARAYASWLSRKVGATYRLPSKSEWLHAARSLTRNGNPCALGNVRDKRASGIGARAECDDGFANTAPSGRFQASALGINDLRGNVAEWTTTCAAADAAGCNRRMVLGMSWQDGPDVDEKRAQDLPADRGYDDVGFRLVRDP